MFENRSFSRQDATYLIDELRSLVGRLHAAESALIELAAGVEGDADECLEGEFRRFVAASGTGVLSRNLNGEDLRQAAGIPSLVHCVPEGTTLEAWVRSQTPGDVDAIAAETKAILSRAWASFEVDLDGVDGSVLKDRLLLSTIRMRAATRLLPEVRRLLGYSLDIEAAASDLDHGTRTLRWVFATSDQKQAVEMAYSYLQSMASGAYESQASRALQSFELVMGLDAQAARRDFQTNPDATLAVLDRIAPGKFVGGRRKATVPPCPFTTHEIDSLLGAYRDTLSKLRGAEARFDRDALRDEARSKAYGMVKREVTEHLRAIPVEELNRGGKGYHVATLRRAGYDNLAAISAATVYNLSSLRGISRNMAQMVKEDCEGLASKLEPSVRLRLSADDKSVEATALVSSLYRLMAAQDVHKRCSACIEHMRGAYGLAKRRLEFGGYDRLSWLVWDDLRDDKTDAYQSLRRGIETDFIEWSSMDNQMGTALAPQPAKAWQAFEESPFEFYELLEEIVPELIGGSGTYGLPEDLAREIEDQDFFPDGLLCTLRRYQEWGVKYTLHQERVLLGDEMGLGKTVQAIASMVSLRNTGKTHFMVVCPASVLVNWCREIGEKSRLRVTKVHGRDTDAALASWARSGGVAVTTYETTARFALPDGVVLGMLVVDEAHYIKNPEARRSQCVRALSSKTDRSLFMTGTALENRVDEMIELMRVLQPDIATRAEEMATLSSAQAFRDAIAPVYYRRKREDVLAEMPDLVESKVWCSLEGPEEVAAYEREVLGHNFMGSRRVSWNVDDIAKNSSKAVRMCEIIDDAKDDGRKVLVFSYFRDTIDKICAMLGPSALPPINGSVSPQRRQEIIDDFEGAPVGSVLVSQIQSGGTGLNIQSASVVVFCEPQLKPSIESQAVSRAYRMGQTRNVLVYRLLCANTVDERITDLLAEKQRSFDAFADQSVAAAESIALDDASQKDIIEREIERIMAKNGASVA